MDMSFYRFMNLFTDVPQIIQQTKRRMLLSHLIILFVEKKNAPFLYLYTFAFLRSNDYLGMYIRVIFVGSLLLYYVPGMLAGIGSVFLYLTFLQLLSLWKHFDSHSLLRLYPLQKAERVQSFHTILFVLLMLQNTIWTAVLSIHIQNAGFLILYFFCTCVIILVLLKRSAKRFS